MCKATADCRPGTGSRALPPSCARYRRGCMWPSAPETGVENRPAQSTRCCRRHCHRTQARYCCTSSTASRRSPSLPHIPCVWHLFHLHSDSRSQTILRTRMEWATSSGPQTCRIDIPLPYHELGRLISTPTTIREPIKRLDSLVLQLCRFDNASFRHKVRALGVFPVPFYSVKWGP